MWQKIYRTYLNENVPNEKDLLTCLLIGTASFYRRIACFVITTECYTEVCMKLIYVNCVVRRYVGRQI